MAQEGFKLDKLSMPKGSSTAKKIFAAEEESEWKKLTRDKQMHRVAMKKAWRRAQPLEKKEEGRRRDREAKAAKRRSLNMEQLREVQQRERESKERRRSAMPDEQRARVRQFDRARQARRRARLRMTRKAKEAELDLGTCHANIKLISDPEVGELSLCNTVANFERESTVNTAVSEIDGRNSLNQLDYLSHVGHRHSSRIVAKLNCEMSGQGNNGMCNLKTSNNKDWANFGRENSDIGEIWNQCLANNLASLNNMPHSVPIPQSDEPGRRAYSPPTPSTPAPSMARCQDNLFSSGTAFEDSGNIKRVGENTPESFDHSEVIPDFFPACIPDDPIWKDVSILQILFGHGVLIDE